MFEVTMTFKRGKERIVVLKRNDGNYSYRLDIYHDKMWRLGPYVGIYDSEEKAESEARARVWWISQDDLH
jgi:hypothetical protein